MSVRRSTRPTVAARSPRHGAALLCLSLVTACGGSELVLPPEQVRLSAVDGGSTVRSDFQVNTCGEPDRLEVRESPTVVEVRTVVRVQGTDCEDIGIPADITAELEQPLGERELVAVETFSD